MRGNILLVDDNEEFIDSVKDILEDEGYHIDTAFNGEAAISISDQSFFDVVLMDIKMPGMNGVECFLEMKHRNPNVRVILFTAYALTDLIQQARNEGVCDVLKKPLNMASLVKTIDEVKKRKPGKHILIADDDEALCDNLNEVLTQNGYQVVSTADGRAAVEAATKMNFDAMLLDIKMPELNGLEIYRQIKKRQPDIVTILMTGYAEEMNDLIEQGIKENAYTCLTKPVEIGQLKYLLKKIFQFENRTTFVIKD